jgi:DNA-binding transcriptional MerR regulator
MTTTARDASPAEGAPTTGYRSSVAARLAGVPVETLRVWERRYGVVGPRLTERGHRLYSADDVSRLTLIRQLVDVGTAIGAIARLSTDELRALLSAGRAAAEGRLERPVANRQPLRVAVIGTSLGAQLAHGTPPLRQLAIVASSTTTADATTRLRGVDVDVLVIEMPTLQADALGEIDALVAGVGAPQAIVAYRFSPLAVLNALRNRGHVTVRAPLDVVELERLCAGLVAESGRRAVEMRAVPSVSGPRFDDQALARISQSLTTLSCECPRHVVELLISLGTFERYSADCANRSPADAELHRWLQQVAGAARASFEDALVRVAAAEGLPLPDASSPATT